MTDASRKAFELWVDTQMKWPLDKFVSGNYEDENCQAAWLGFKLAYETAKSIYEKEIEACGEEISALEAEKEQLEDEVEAKNAQISRMVPDVRKIVEALDELVKVKIIKEIHGECDDYLRRQPIAWESAKQAIAALPPEWKK